MLNRFSHFTASISAIYRDIQKIERDEMEKRGLRGSFAQYLLVISQYPDGVTAAQLRESSDRDKAAVSRVLSEMEEKGLITRAGGKENLYRAKVKLTSYGEEIVAYISRKAAAAAELAGRGLTEEDRKVFYSALALIAGNLQQISKEGLSVE